MMKVHQVFVAAATASVLLLAPANAAVVDAITDGEDGGEPPVAGTNRVFVFGGWEKSVVTAGDGNVHYKWVLPPQDQGSNSPANGVGPSWPLFRTDFESVLGHTLGPGDVLRFSAWVAMDDADPLLGQGPWTDNIQFEFNDGVDNEVSEAGGPTADLLPSGCDLGTGLCGNPGAWGISSSDWTLVSYTYELTAADTVANVDIVEPVIFIGDFTGSEYEQGTMYLDNMLVEVFDDLATANATSILNPHPGGIVPEPATVLLTLIGAAMLLRASRGGSAA